MEIRGVSSTTAIRPTAFQPTEAGSASASRPAETTGAAVTGETEKTSGAGYISPFLRYDQGARVAVLYFRDFDTGETQDQIPSQRVVEEYRRTASRLTQEDERKSAAAKTASAGSVTGAAAGSADGSADGTGTSSGSGYTPAASDSGPSGTSIGVSFASASGSGGTTAGAGGTAPTTGGFTPAVTGGGRTGGSPGGLVSVTV